MIASHLGLEIEGPDHAQGEDDTDDSRHGDGTDMDITGLALGMR